MANNRTKKSATKRTTSAGSSSSGNRVTRITASDSKSPKRTSTKSAKSMASSELPKQSPAPKKTVKREKTIKSGKPTRKVSPSAAPNEIEQTRNPLTMLGRYFRGAWYELNQVRWPDRATTWQMTGALLAFTAFFVLLIVLLDGLFKYLFEFILG